MAFKTLVEAWERARLLNEDCAQEAVIDTLKKERVDPAGYFTRCAAIRRQTGFSDGRSRDSRKAAREVGNLVYERPSSDVSPEFWLEVKEAFRFNGNELAQMISDGYEPRTGTFYCKKGHTDVRIFWRTDGRAEKYCRSCRCEWQREYRKSKRVGTSRGAR